MDEVIVEKIEENWLEWISLPFTFLIMALAYVGLVLNVDSWFGILLTVGGYLLLAVPFLLLFVGYLLWCILHQRKLKKTPAVQEEADPEEQKKAEKAAKSKSVWVTTCAILTAVAMLIVFLLLLANDKSLKDGKYVIWAEKYHVSMSPEVTHEFYLVGDAVRAKGDELTDYTARSVLELDFEKDGTFTITHEGKLLGVVPKKNGIGYREECTSTLWELEEVEPGVYYIRNVEENTYLKWFEAKTNWTTHPNIVDDNRSQYLMRLEFVK